jgi:hypothetical protein
MTAMTVTLTIDQIVEFLEAGGYEDLEQAVMNRDLAYRHPLTRRQLTPTQRRAMRHVLESDGLDPDEKHVALVIASCVNARGQINIDEHIDDDIDDPPPFVQSH